MGVTQPKYPHPWELHVDKALKHRGTKLGTYIKTGISLFITILMAIQGTLKNKLSTHGWEINSLHTG